MVFRQVYPTPATDASASYDFEDIEEAIGFVRLYAATTSGSKILTRNIVHSTDITTFDNSIAAGKEIDIDFDTSAFNLPRVAKGTATVSIPFAVQTTGAGGRCEAYTIADIKHVRDSTETSIGRSTSGAQWISPTGSGAIFSGSQLHKIALTQKIFKKGDFVRLTTEGWVVTAGAGIEIGHDPKNRNSGNLLTAGPTELISDIPFVIDL